MSGLFVATATVITFVIKAVFTLISLALWLASCVVPTRTIAGLRCMASMDDMDWGDFIAMCWACAGASLLDAVVFIPSGLIALATLVRIPFFPACSEWSKASASSNYYDFDPRANLFFNAIHGLVAWIVVFPSLILSLLAPWRWPYLAHLIMGTDWSLEDGEPTEGVLTIFAHGLCVIADYVLGLGFAVSAILTPWRWPRISRELKDAVETKPWFSGDLSDGVFDPEESLELYGVALGQIFRAAMDALLLIPLAVLILGNLCFRLVLSIRSYAKFAAQRTADGLEPFLFHELVWMSMLCAPLDLFVALVALPALLFPHRWRQIFLGIREIRQSRQNPSTAAPSSPGFSMNPEPHVFAARTAGIFVADVFVAIPALCIALTHRSYLAYREYKSRTEPSDDSSDGPVGHTDNGEPAPAAATTTNLEYSLVPHGMILKHFAILVLELVFVLPLALLLLVTVYRLVFCIKSVVAIRAANNGIAPEFTVHKQIATHAFLLAIELFVLPPMFIPLLLTGYRLRFLRSSYNAERVGALIRAVGTQFGALCLDIPFALLALLAAVMSLYRVPNMFSGFRSAIGIPGNAPHRAARVKAALRLMATDAFFHALFDILALPCLALVVLSLYRLPALFVDLKAAYLRRAQVLDSFEHAPVLVQLGKLPASSDDDNAGPSIEMASVPVARIEYDVHDDLRDETGGIEWAEPMLSVFAYTTARHALRVLEELAVLLIMIVLLIVPWRAYEALCLLALPASEAWRVDVIAAWKLRWQGSWAREWHAPALRTAISSTFHSILLPAPDSQSRNNYRHDRYDSEARWRVDESRSGRDQASNMPNPRVSNAVPLSLSSELAGMGDTEGAELARALHDAHTEAWTVAAQVYEAKAWARPEYNLDVSTGRVIGVGEVLDLGDDDGLRKAYEDATVTRMQEAMDGVAAASAKFNGHIQEQLRVVGRPSCPSCPSAMFARTRESAGGNVYLALIALGSALLDILCMVGAIVLLVTVVRAVPTFRLFMERARLGMTPRSAIPMQLAELGIDVLCFGGFLICFASVIQTYGVLFSMFDAIVLERSITAAREAIALHLMFLLHPIGWIYGFFWTVFGMWRTYGALIVGAIWGPLAPMELFAKLMPCFGDGEFVLCSAFVLGVALYTVPLVGLYSVMVPATGVDAHDTYATFVGMSVGGLVFILVMATLFSFMSERGRDRRFLSRPEWLLVPNMANVVAVLCVAFELIQLVGLALLMWNPLQRSSSVSPETSGVGHWIGLGLVRMFAPVDSIGGFVLAMVLVGLFYLIVGACLVAEFVFHMVSEGVISESVAWQSLISVFGGPGFVYVVYSLLDEVACKWDPVSQVLRLGRDPAIVCFKGSHTGRAFWALLGLTFFVPLSSMLLTHFTDENAPRLTFQYRGSYTLSFVLVKSLVVGFAVFGGGPGSAAVCAGLLVAFTVFSVVYAMVDVPAALPGAHRVRTAGLAIVAVVFVAAAIGAEEDAAHSGPALAVVALGTIVVLIGFAIAKRRAATRALGDAGLRAIERVRDAADGISEMERAAAVAGVVPLRWRREGRKMVRRLLQQCREDGDWELLQRVLVALEEAMFCYYDGPQMNERWQIRGVHGLSTRNVSFYRKMGEYSGMATTSPCYAAPYKTIRQPEWRRYVREPGNQWTVQGAHGSSGEDGRVVLIGAPMDEYEALMGHVGRVTEWLRTAHEPDMDALFGLHHLDHVPLSAGGSAVRTLAYSGGSDGPWVAVDPNGAGGVGVALPGKVIVPIVPEPGAPPFVDLSIRVCGLERENGGFKDVDFTVNVYGKVGGVWNMREWTVRLALLFPEPEREGFMATAMGMLGGGSGGGGGDGGDKGEKGGDDQGGALGKLVRAGLRQLWGGNDAESPAGASERRRAFDEFESQESQQEEVELQEEAGSSSSGSLASRTHVSDAGASDSHYSYYSDDSQVGGEAAGSGPVTGPGFVGVARDVGGSAPRGVVMGGQNNAGLPTFNEVVAQDAGMRVVEVDDGADWLELSIAVDNPMYDDNMMFTRVAMTSRDGGHDALRVEVFVGIR